jgi:hypothetical protein
MKITASFCSILFSLSLTAQLSEDYIPKDAVTVLSLNNIALFQKVSMDDLVQYEFMSEVQSELFDGSTSGKTLKDAGIDFNQKLHIFYGKGTDFEVSGFTFGITDRTQLFQVFDDFDKIPSKIEGVEFYNSYFNHLLIKGEVAILVRVDPTPGKINQMTDSLWYARGNEPIYSDEEGMLEEEIEEIETIPSIEEITEEAYAKMAETESLIDEYELPASNEDITRKNYSELHDSVEVVLQQAYLDWLCNDLFVDRNNLKKNDPRYAQQLTHQTEGVFYLDNSRNLQKSQGLWYFESMFPSLYEDMKSLYSENVILGDLILNDESIELKLDAHYGEILGSIYEKMNHSHLDKKVLRYIPENSPAYFSYKVNLREAYEQTFKTIIPLLKQEKNPKISETILTLELLNEFINKDALFGTYKGSMFGTFNGVKKVEVTRIEYAYDEETFEYQETEVKATEDMPIFTLGFSINRPDIPEKVLNHISRLTSQCTNQGTYWKFENAILESVPLYMINRKGLFIFTNDEDLAVNHTNGYGSDRISRKDARKIKRGGFLYAKIDWGQTLEQFPREMFSEERNEMLDAMRGKTGIMELKSSKTTKNKTSFDVIYNFSGQYTNSARYLLDLVNSIYVVSK